MTESQGKLTVEQAEALGSTSIENRGVAQLGSASALGAEGPRFKSGRPDQITKD